MQTRLENLHAEVFDGKCMLSLQIQTFVSELERRIIDLQNRSRCNNLVFWNVPEGSEKYVTMVEFIKKSFTGAYEIGWSRRH